MKNVKNIASAQKNNIEKIIIDEALQQKYLERYKALLQLVKASTMISNATIISNPTLLEQNKQKN